MRPGPNNAAGFLASNRFFVLADLYTFATVYGEFLRYSGSSVPYNVPAGLVDGASINAGTGGFFGLGPRFGRTKIQTKIGTQVDKIDLEIYAGPNDLIGAANWQYLFFNGLFDGATVEIGRAISQPAPGGGVGPLVSYVVWFQGNVGDAEIGRTTIKVTVNSKLTELTTQYPRRLWQNGCGHIFGDAMCQFDRYSMAATVTAQTGSTTSQIVTGFVPSPNYLYDDGTALSLNGNNGGIKRTVALGSDNGTYFLTVPFIYPVSAGDYFSLLPGCDHSWATCQNVFNNIIHYGGMPFIPPAEYSV